MNRIEALHHELQAKEEVIMKSRLAVQQLLFKADESKTREAQLQEKVIKQKTKLRQFVVEKQQLEEQIKKMTSQLYDDDLQANAKELFKAQIHEAETRIKDIEAREQAIHERNKHYEEELQKVQHQKMELDQKIAKMELVRESLVREKQQLLDDVASQEKQIRLSIQESERLQKQLQASRKEQEAAYSLFSEELEKRTATELEKEEINRKYDKMMEQWGSDKKKYMQKETRLEKRLGRRISGSIPNILVEPEFEKDYLELSEQEQTGVDAALYELSLGWHTGNVTFRPNSVKGRTTCSLNSSVKVRAALAALLVISGTLLIGIICFSLIDLHIYVQLSVDYPPSRPSIAGSTRDGSTCRHPCSAKGGSVKSRSRRGGDSMSDCPSPSARERCVHARHSVTGSSTPWSPDVGSQRHASRRSSSGRAGSTSTFR